MQALVSYISVTDRITFISSTYYITILSVVSYTYPIFIFYAHISLITKEEFHYVEMAPYSCPVQGSPLMEEKQKEQNFMK